MKSTGVMQLLRSTWGKRVLVALLTASLASVLVTPAAQAARRSTALTYADWLRTQLCAEPGEAVAQALYVASEADVTTLRGFLSVFVEAFEARQPGARLATVFRVQEDLSNDALILHLRGQFQRLDGNAVLPQEHFLASAGFSAKTSDRFAAFAALSGSGGPPVYAGTPAHPAAPTAAFVFPVRLISAAHPLGP